MGKGVNGCEAQAVSEALTLEIPGSGPGEIFYAIEGVLDSEARAAFTFGHCHSLALALHERTGWPMLGLQHHSKEINHVVVVMPDGRWLDAKGPHPANPAPYPGAKPPLRMSSEEVIALGERKDWLSADPSLAESFVSPLLEEAAA